MLRFLFIASLLSALNAPVFAGVSFNRDVRPILSDTCFACHGPDEGKRKAKLRLDVRESALQGGESGDAAIVPGHPEKSELVTRIVSTDRDEVMPPPKDHRQLKPEQVATLRRWIAEGAEYQGHWAFQKPVRPAAPVGAEGNPIDAFIRARLPEANLTPSPEADRATLLRRVSLDLTGLPPTPEELDTFLKDPRPEAYERQVDRLLASPRYGERMAIQWLDFARYADSNGFQSDTSREMWHWRDWVIEAFNRNLPFDQFTIEQLAGDLLPHPTRDQIIATGFHRNHRLNGEGGRIVEEWFAENVIDRVETTGLTWLGLTLNCCRCHDHKFDPVTQKEFYSLSAFFNSCEETGVLGEFGGSGSTRQGGNTKPILFLPSPEQEKQQAALEEAVRTAEQEIAGARRSSPAAQTAWEQTLRTRLAEGARPWHPVEQAEARSRGGATLTRQPDGSWLAGGANPKNDTYEITAPLAPGPFTGLLLEALPDPSLPSQSLGRAGNGNFVLSGVEAEITVPGEPQPRRAQFTRAEADYEQPTWEIGLIFAAAKAEPAKRKAAKAAQSGWAIAGNLPENRVQRTALFACQAMEVPAGATLTVRLVHGSRYTDHNMGRFRLSTTSAPAELLSLKSPGLPEEVVKALRAELATRTAGQKQALASLFATSPENPAKRAADAVADAKKKLDDFLKSLPSTMVMQEAAQPREAFVLTRGEYDKPGAKVARGVPAALPPMPAGAPVNRLGLAQWIVSPENPLTARVWVNRAWEKFFGTGLVKTSENFGSQAEWPSHPELLDWLACEFMQPTTIASAAPWDMKALQKLIVLSATYRQSARVTPALLERDPDNRLLARGPRFRLTAELLRDQALAVSGLLVDKQGGPSVRPYMPPGVWDETSVYGNMRNYQPDTGEGLYRRTLYTVWKRTAAPPTMLLFDSPNREICTVKRSRTNTPTQALALLNEVTCVEAARALATRMLQEGGATAEQRMAWGFRRVTCREPDAEELRILVTGVQKRLATFAARPEAAAELIRTGASKAPTEIPPPELAAWTAAANVLLNLDEVVTRE